ncbi:MAG: AMP-binding protein [Acidimicrobiales bacterium]
MTNYYTEFSPTFEDRSDWASPTVLRHHAEARPDSVYLDVPWEGISLTYAETLAQATAIGRGMLEAGASPGDRLLIMIPNCSEYILGWLGSACAGLAEVPINTAYKGAFLEHQTRTVTPTLALVDPAYADRFVDVADAAETVKRFVLVGGDDASRAEARSLLEGAGFAVGTWEELVAAGEASDAELPEVRYCDLGSVFFTSGTTGLSKGVMMPHAHMHMFADQAVSLTRCTPDDVYMTTGPLFHGNSSFLGAYPALIAGARYVMQERFSATRWIDQIRDSGATITNFVGVMMDFAWQQEERPDDADNDLRCIFAAPTAHSFMDGFKERFGVEEFVEVFGLTETCCPILSPYGVERPPGAAGLVNNEWFDVRLVDRETDEEVPVGEVGEMVVRGKVPWIHSTGYFAMGDKTAESFRNLWWHTGDGLRRDEYGWHYFVDRMKDAIRRRGENISSFEVEQALLPHPAVHEVSVVAVPADQEAGEDEVMAFVVLSEGAELDPTEFWEYAETRLPYFAVPRYVRVIDELPKTPSEKVRKVELRNIGADDQTHDRGPTARGRRDGTKGA